MSPKQIAGELVPIVILGAVFGVVAGCLTRFAWVLWRGGL